MVQKSRIPGVPGCSKQNIIDQGGTQVEGRPNFDLTGQMASDPGRGAGKCWGGTDLQDGMCQQGAWTRWEGTLERKHSWTNIWKAEPQQIKFLIQVVHDILPSPVNLHVWDKADSPTCALCSRNGTLENILSSSPTAPGEAATAGKTTRCLRQLKRPKISKAIDKNKHVLTRRTSPLSELEICQATYKCIRLGGGNWSSLTRWQQLGGNLVSVSLLVSVPIQLFTSVLMPTFSFSLHVLFSIVCLPISIS